MVLAWPSRTSLLLTGAAASATLLAGCSVPGTSPANPGGGGGGGGAQNASFSAPRISITPSDQAQNVALDVPVQVTSDTGRLRSVTVTEAGSAAAPAGQLSADGRTWRLSGGLDPGASYTISAVAANGTQTATSHASFSTLTAQDRLLTSFTPEDGSTVGVGQPIDLKFTSPISDDRKAALLQRIQVSSDPGVVGAWHWFSDSVVHFRPANYWPAGTKVTLTANLKGFDAGNGVWGLGDWSMSFSVGQKHVSVIDDSTDEMKVYANDQLINTWPVSLGKPGFPTLSGTLVVLYKQYAVKMNSCTTFGGAACIPGSTNYYNENVYYDTAISVNGFFIHAAPWSVYAQGRYDVSHGCVNLSTERAINFYNWSQVGDVVIIKNTPNIADYSNGEADWQIAFKQLSNTPGLGSVWTGASNGSPPGGRVF